MVSLHFWMGRVFAMGIVCIKEPVSPCLKCYKTALQVAFENFY